jgi:hypothetical protein
VFVNEQGLQCFRSARCAVDAAVLLLHAGCVEVVLDRRLGQDDWRGLNEGLVDNVQVASDFVLLFETFAERRAHHVSTISTFYQKSFGISDFIRIN